MADEKHINIDVEKASAADSGASSPQSAALAALPSDSPAVFKQGWAKRLLTWGIESRGIVPVSASERTDTKFFKIFFVWFSINFNILSFSTGGLGPVAFGLGLRDTSLTILFFNLIACLLPAYMNTWGPKTGMRQMVHSRYSFGYFGIMLPVLLNLISLCGFNILNCILGGQALSAVTDNQMSWTVGIVIIVIISLILCFMGYTVLLWFERIAWFPTLLAFLVALGLGGKNLFNGQPVEPATAVTILSFGAVIAGFVITFAGMASDFTMYFKPDVSRTKIFWYAYIGYLLPIVTLEVFGAAAAIAAPTIPSWNDGYGTEGNVGGLLNAMLSPVGRFGKFLTVMLSLSVASNIAATLYSICFNFQILIPPLSRVPRYVFSVVGSAIALPIAIVGAHRFYEALTNFLSLIGYWASAYCGILIVEHHYFRRNDFSTYDQRDWDVPGRLPWGAAALGAGILSFALIIPCMNQIWFVGPIGAVTGDIGFEVAFPLAAVLYIPLRKMELRYQRIPERDE
ncbi:NCS cytosine-purine permease [Coniophora puteana RWD-64-598 SS2]|uniref:NCS cytosine-purine permease n=1 Tax=Coniophora puteana (strain RWD-64-598) TaxID=741705 RepID=A0A5M3MFA1_CONPW|nr:NCS cytosine-purine permease [Coniophora puteana RWD-64-598 SS2]EIW77295.1 NCS cytosine-purine permease [Coniophora puteana RWD-64-598 SS2]